ncbi:MAG TPA: hypothetical protein VN962_28130, partial [Polyangia bacterium]|nr:hypothetical protein [Polyangia bacterium]
VQVHLAQVELGGGAPRLGPEGTARLDVQVSRAHLAAAAGAVTVAGVHAALAAQPVAGGRWEANVSLRVGAADVTGPTRLSVRGARLETRAKQVKIDVGSPAASAGNLTVEGEVAGLDARTPALRAAVDRLGLRLAASVSGRPPYAAELQVPVGALRLFDRRGRRLLDTPARIVVSAAHVQPDGARPIAGRGDLRVTVEAGDVQASVDAHKRADDVDLDVTLKAATLAAARPFLPPDLAAKLNWDHLSLDLHTNARVGRLSSSSPTVRQESALRVQGLRAGRTGAHLLALEVRSNGDARRHEADVTLAANGIAIDGRAAPDTKLHLTAQVDRGQPAAKLHLDADGAARLGLDAAVAVTGSSRRLDCDLDLKADRLVLAGALRPFVPALEGVDLRRATLGVQVHAGLTGLVERVGRRGELRLARDPVRTVAGAADVTLRVGDVGVTQGATQVGLGALSWKLGLHAAGGRRELSSDLRLDGVRLASGEQRIELARLQDTASVLATGDPATATAELTNRLLLTGLRQDLAPFVPTDEIKLDLVARRQPDGMMEVRDLRLTDAQAGTALAASGAVALGSDRRLSLRGHVDQDLGKLRRLPSRMTASGHVGLSFSVESPDLETFRTRAGLALDDVNLRAPAAGLAIETADAKIPIDMRVVLGPDGVTIPHDVRPNPYASLRFADQAPLQARSSFLSIVRLTTPFATVAPLAGNLSVDQNVFSLGQLEMGVRGGHVTGRCVVDWQK